MNTVDYGKTLEHYIAAKFQELGFKNACRSNGSGNKGTAGDISGQDIFVVECKQRNTNDITLKLDVWKKLCGEIPLHSTRLPLYVLGNSDNKRWAVMDVNDFFIILKGYLENNGEKT